MLHAGTKIESQVFGLHLSMIKNLVVSSIDSDADRLRFIQASKGDDDESINQDNSQNSDENDEDLDDEASTT